MVGHDFAISPKPEANAADVVERRDKILCDRIVYVDRTAHPWLAASDFVHGGTSGKIINVGAHNTQEASGFTPDSGGS
jgi:hypothetical protein